MWPGAFFLVGRGFLSSFLCSGVETGMFPQAWVQLSGQTWMPVYGKARPACFPQNWRQLCHRSYSSSNSILVGELVSRHPSDSLVFGRSLLPGPLFQHIWCKQPIRLHQHFPQILPVRRLQPLPAVLSECMLWRKTVTTSLWKRNQKKTVLNHKEKEKGNLAKILKEPHLQRLQDKNYFV